jgi:hypothetical protein
MPTALYFLHNKLLAQATFPCDFTPHSLAYFCPTCGEVWGRIMIDGGKYWSVEHVACEKHLPQGIPEWGNIPGAFCTNPNSSRNNLSIMWWGRALEHLPLPILQREFALILNHYEKESE